MINNQASGTKMKTMISILFAATLPLWLGGCGQGGHSQHEPGHGHEHGEHGHHADEEAPSEVTLSEATIRRHGIEIANVSDREMQSTFSVPARVAFNEETIAHVGALVSGRISDMKAHIGETVKKGDVLFVIESPELGRAQNSFLQALDANATAWAAKVLAENNATVTKVAAGVLAAATQLALTQKTAVVKAAEADVKSAEALLTFAENSATVDKAKADLRTAFATVALANNNATIATAQGKLDGAQPVLKRAQEFYESGKKLAESGAIANAELKRRESAMMTANAEVTTARAALAQAKAELARDQQAAVADEQAATATLAQVRAQQTRDITAAKAKVAAAIALLTAAIAKKEQNIAAARADLAAATAALQAAQAEKVKDRQKAKSTHKAARANVATARNQLELFGMDDNKIKALQKDRILTPDYTVVAPRNGTVVTREVTEGENVNPDQPHLLILADLTKVWVLMDIPPRRAGLIRKDQPLELIDTDTDRAVQITAPTSKIPITFNLDFISPVVDAETRTIQARVEVANHGGVLRPGQFLTALLHTGDGRVKKPAVPAAAVQYADSKPTVYVQVKGKNFTFKQRTVGVGQRVNDWIPITFGLKIGDAVVVKGSFILKAEFGKAGAGHDHSH